MHSVLTINGGSSNLRFALFKVGESLPRILIGKFDRIGLSNARLSFTDVLAHLGDSAATAGRVILTHLGNGAWRAKSWA